MDAATVERLSEMWAQGMPVKQIAREVGYSTGYIYQIARANKDMFPKMDRRIISREQEAEAERMWADGMTIRQMADRLGVNDHNIRDLVQSDRTRFPKRGHGGYWRIPDDKKRAALGMLEGGMSVRKVSEELGIAATTLRRWVHGWDA